MVIFADYGITVAVWHKLLRERLARSCDQVLLALGWRRVSGAGTKQQQDQRPRRHHLGARVLSLSGNAESCLK